MVKFFPIALGAARSSFGCGSATRERVQPPRICAKRTQKRLGRRQRIVPRGRDALGRRSTPTTDRRTRDERAGRAVGVRVGARERLRIAVPVDRVPFTGRLHHAAAAHEHLLPAISGGMNCSGIPATDAEIGSAAISGSGCKPSPKWDEQHSRFRPHASAALSKPAFGDAHRSSVLGHPGVLGISRVAGRGVSRMCERLRRLLWPRRVRNRSGTQRSSDHSRASARARRPGARGPGRRST